jgi:hypothetical protein
MKPITPLSLSQCWKMVNRISNLDQAKIAEDWLLAADISIEDYDELMMAVSVIVQDLYRLPNRSFM